MTSHKKTRPGDQYKKLLILCFSLIILAFQFIHFTPAFAVDNVAETTFFGNIKDDGNGCGVYTILGLIVDILSIGIGILAVIGITIVGIKYLTAGGNVEQTKKAKHRISQIVLGLVAYVLLYAGLQWLLPGGKLNTNQQCTTISDQELAALKAQEAAKKAAKEQAEQAAKKKTSSSSSSSSKTNSNSASNANNRTKMLEAAEYTAKYFADHKFIYHDYPAESWASAKNKHKENCASFTVLAAKKAGLVPDNGPSWWFTNHGKTIHISNSAKVKKSFEIIKPSSNYDTISKAVKAGKLGPGDIIGSGQYTAHTLIYAGKKNGKCLTHQILDKSMITNKNQILNKSVSCSYKIGYILHIK